MKIQRQKYKIFFVLAAIVAVFFVFGSKEVAAANEWCCVEIKPDGSFDCRSINRGANCPNNFFRNEKQCKEILGCPQCPTKKGEEEKKPPKFQPPKLQIKLPERFFPGFTEEEEKLIFEEEGKQFYRFPWIGEYIEGLFKFGTLAISIIAVIMIMIAGFQWMTAVGNPSKIGQAKSKISDALFGLILILGASLLLSFINPNLTIFKPIVIEKIKEIELVPRGGSVGVGAAGQGKVKEYNAMGCPTAEEKKNGFTALITAYYNPSDLNETCGSKTIECNVAIQCGCTGVGITEEVCVPGVKSCNKIDTLEKLKKACPGKGATGKLLTGFSSVAADVAYKANKWGKKCFQFNEKFQIINSNNSDFNRIWTIEDTGSYIQGRHFDLFVGNNCGLANSVTEEVTIKFVE